MTRVTATFLAIESRRFVTVDLGWADGEEAYLPPLVLESVEDAVIRIRYSATEEQARRIDHAEITRKLYAAGASKVFAIQPTIIRENRARVEGVTEEIAPLAAVDAWCEANGIDDHAPLADLTARYLQEAVA